MPCFVACSDACWRHPAGERRRLMVPWHMGHGKEGSKGVPPYSDLQYDIELIELANPKIPPTKKAKKEL